MLSSVVRKLFVAMVYVRPALTLTKCSSSSGCSQTAYQKPPADFVLKYVSIIHRHGDRAQISRSLGAAYPENDSITKKWKNLLPRDDTLQKLYSVAKHSSTTEQCIYERSKLYSGWDCKNSPYAQLTEIGAQQLIAVGSNLRARYLGTLIHSNDDHLPLYCRSTNMCRTIQSLRALLVGLTGADVRPFPALPVIHSRPRHEECMYGQADGRVCPPLTRRRAELDTHPARMPSVRIGDDAYETFEARMQGVLQFPDGKVRWMDATDVLTCHHAHGFDHIRGVSEGDVHRVSSIAAWIWGVIYKDDDYNRLSIGRFLHDLLSDMHASLGLPFGATESSSSMEHTQQTKMSIYSGHDSTLVPVLCALGIYEECWPPYASNLSLEVAQRTSSGELFVRAIYNDEEKYMRSCVGSDNGSTLTSWCPLSLFVARLSSLTLTPAEYEVEMKKI